MEIAVGTQNAAKLKAVQLAIDQLKTLPSWPAGANTIKIEPVKVASAVSAQPMSDDETMRGAIARARAALDATPAATFGIGLEGGVQEICGRWLECGFIAVVERASGRVGLGTSARYELSAKIVARLQQGEELSQVIDDLSGQDDVRSSQGAMGILTMGLLPRDVCYAQGVIFAFAPFISGSHFWL